MSVDSDAWTCPDCYETVRGAGRAAAQRVHGVDHGRDRRILAARRAQAIEDRAEAKAASRAAHTHKRIKRGARGAQ